jgi:hypothetical protein
MTQTVKHNGIVLIITMAILAVISVLDLIGERGLGAGGSQWPKQPVP